jgi:hypothetical protein
MATDAALDPRRVPPAPRQPSGAARALVFSDQGAQLVYRILGSVFLPLGLLIFLFLGHALPLDLALDLGGQPGSGEVTGVETTHVRVNRQMVREVSYRYAAGGATRSGTSSTTDHAIHSLPPGSPVALDVLPSVPSVSRIQGTTIGSVGRAGVLLLLMPLVGLVLLLKARRARRRRIRAFTHGTPVVARVTAFAEDTSARINGRHPTRLAWSFEAGGQSYEGALTHMDRAALAPLMHEGQMVVLHDPDDPSVNAPWVG